MLSSVRDEFALEIPKLLTTVYRTTPLTRYTHEASVTVALMDGKGELLTRKDVELMHPEEAYCHEYANRTIVGGDIPYVDFPETGFSKCATHCLVRCAFSTESYTRGCHWIPRMFA
jgi:hypothetical protein